MKVVCIIQARMGSSRLPGKSLKPLCGRPLIAHVIERAQTLPVDAVYIATTTLADDNALAELAADLGASVYRGYEKDVLARMGSAAEVAKAEAIVRITGDCPLMATDVGAKVIGHFHRFYESDRVDYCWNDTLSSGFPDGTDIEVFTMEALQCAARGARRDADREHVTTWIRRWMKIATVVSVEDFSSLKLSVDSAEDYARVNSIMAHVPRGAFALADTVKAARAAGLLE